MDLETAIQQFLESARVLQGEHTLTAETVLRRVIQFYRDTRIEGATSNPDADMLLLQWGAINPLTAHKPMDFRNASDEDIEFEEAEYQYIDFTRQVFPAGGDEDADFDESAVHLSMTLIYGPATGDELSANQWIDKPDQIEREIEKFKSVPFVRCLLGTKAARLVTTVDFCG